MGYLHLMAWAKVNWPYVAAALAGTAAMLSHVRTVLQIKKLRLEIQHLERQRELERAQEEATAEAPLFQIFKTGPTKEEREKFWRTDRRISPTVESRSTGIGIGEYVVIATYALLVILSHFLLPQDIKARILEMVFLEYESTPAVLVPFIIPIALFFAALVALTVLVFAGGLIFNFVYARVERRNLRSSLRARRRA